MSRALRTVFANALCYTGLLRPYVRLRGARGGGAAAVITFHRLIDERSTLLRKAPTVHTPARLFEDIVRMLVRHYPLVSLSQVAAHLAANEPFDRDCVAIAFDDGYEDNFRLGLPVFQRYRIPATIFLATGFIGTGAQMWTDRVEAALRRTACEALDTSRIPVPGPPARWPLVSRRDRELANRAIAERLKEEEAGVIDESVQRLERALGVGPAAAERSMLTWDEIRALSAAGVEIGSHGVSHVIMTRLPVGRAIAELEDSKKTIEAAIQRPVRHFAFPNGREQDFSDDLAHACRRLGYESVSSCVYGANRPGTDDPYRIRRVGIGNSAPLTLLAIERLFQGTRHRAGIVQ